MIFPVRSLQGNGLDQTSQNQNELRLEWHFLRNFQLEADYGDAGEGGADVVFRHRF